MVFKALRKEKQMSGIDWLVIILDLLAINVIFGIFYVIDLIKGNKEGRKQEYKKYEELEVGDIIFKKNGKWYLERRNK